MNPLSCNYFSKLCLFLGFLLFASIVKGEEIELFISRDDTQFQRSKEALRLHFISHKNEDVRLFTFSNGSATCVFLVDLYGRLVPSKRFSFSSKNNIEYRKPFHILPGDVTGTVKNLKDFKFKSSGLHFMIFAIPRPLGRGLIFSKPCKILISNDYLIEEINTVSFEDLPSQVRLTFREEFKEFFAKVKFASASLALPF